MVGKKLAGEQVVEDLAVVVVKVVVKVVGVEKQEGQQRTLHNEEAGVEMEGLKGQPRRIQNEKAQVVVVGASV